MFVCFVFKISVSRITGAKVCYFLEILIHLTKLLFKKVVLICILTITWDSLKTALIFIYKYHPQICEGMGNIPYGEQLPCVLTVDMTTNVSSIFKSC